MQKKILDSLMRLLAMENEILKLAENVESKQYHYFNYVRPLEEQIYYFNIVVNNNDNMCYNSNGGFYESQEKRRKH